MNDVTTGAPISFGEKTHKDTDFAWVRRLLASVSAAQTVSSPSPPSLRSLPGETLASAGQAHGFNLEDLTVLRFADLPRTRTRGAPWIGSDPE